MKTSLLLLINLTILFSCTNSDKTSTNEIKEGLGNAFINENHTSQVHLKKSKNEITNLSIIEYSGEDIIETRISKSEINCGSIDENSGKYFQLFQSTQDTNLLKDISENLDKIIIEENIKPNSDEIEDELIMTLYIEYENKALVNISVTELNNTVITNLVNKINTELTDTHTISY